MSPARPEPRRAAHALCAVLLATLVLAGCGDKMVFAERTGLAIGSVRLGEDADQPINVNIGFERRIFALTPPMGGVVQTEDGSYKAKGEAASLLSGFEMGYIEGTTIFDGKLRVRTQFASGRAAVAVADDPATAIRLMNVRAARPIVSDRREVAADIKDYLDTHRGDPDITGVAESLGWTRDDGDPWAYVVDANDDAARNTDRRRFDHVMSAMRTHTDWEPPR